MIESAPPRPSTAALFADALAKTSQLIGSEMRLVQIELSEKIATAIRAVVAIIAAAVFLIVALIFLLQGLVAVLVEHGLSASLSSFAVGGAIAVVALVAIVVASRSLSASNMRPAKSLRQLHENTTLMKDGTP